MYNRSMALETIIRRETRKKKRRLVSIQRTETNEKKQQHKQDKPTSVRSIYHFVHKETE